MGTWSEALNGSDTFCDVYESFYTMYNEGLAPTIAAQKVLADINEDFCDIDELHDSLFALGFAQWETKCLDQNLYQKIKKIIDSGENIELWKGAGSTDVSLKKRKQVLGDFLSKISVEKQKAKRRSKPKFEFSTLEVVKVISPNGEKLFAFNEEYTNGKYIHTSGLLEWKDGGSGIAYFQGQGKKISAEWTDNNTLQITHEKEIVFIKKEVQSRNFSDIVYIVYNELD